MYNLLVTKPLNSTKIVDNWYHQKYFVISYRGSFDTFQIFQIFRVKVLGKLECE